MIGSGAEVNGPTTGTSRSDAAYSLYSTTHYLFDALGRLVKIVDPKNNETSIIYDSLSRRRQMDHVDTASAWVFSYDKNGNLKSQTDSKGHTVTFSYDPLNRITEKLYPGGGKVLYDYDDDAVANSDGKLTRARVVDSAGVDQSRVEFAYDKIGRATTTKYMVRDSSTEVSRSFVNTYDSMSRIKSIKYPDNETVTYSYDTGGNISQISGYATFPSYTALGQAKTIAYANGVATDLTYWNTHQRLETLQTTGPGGALQGLYYDIYDKAGNIRSIQDNLATARAQTFTYKPIPSNPLATARSTAYGNLGLTYDVSDNITNYTPVGVYTPKTGYSGLIAEAGPYVFSHDSNGNTRVIVENDAQGVEIGRRTITCDYDHRVISVNVSGTATRCAYDFSGMRVKKQTGASSTLYFGELFESTDGSNMKHIFAGSRRIASKKSANEIYYYHADHLGSTRVLTDKNGNEVQTFFYEPFGKTKAVTGSSPINYKYTGQEEDTETGLYYYKARYYDPVIGRFLSQDPLFQAAFDPPTFPRLSGFDYLPKEPPIFKLSGSGADSGEAGNDQSPRAVAPGKSLNFSAYAGNNPIGNVDPTGNIFWDILDIASFGDSLYSFFKEPSWGNAGMLAWDTLAILPIVPSSATVKIADKVMDVASSAGCMAAKDVKLLTASENLADHHIFPQTYRGWFQERGIENIDQFTVTLDRWTHLGAVHGNGNMGQLPGRWNKAWSGFIDANPFASSLEIYQQAGRMMDEFGISHLPVHYYKLP